MELSNKIFFTIPYGNIFTAFFLLHAYGLILSKQLHHTLLKSNYFTSTMRP